MTTAKARIGCRVHSCAERWPIKRLSDHNLRKLDFASVEKTVPWLVSQRRLHKPPEDARVALIESQTFKVKGQVVGLRQVTDNEFHTVVPALQHLGEATIVEIPQCSGPTRRVMADFQKDRQGVISKLGQPTPRSKRLKQAIQVTAVGIGFFDFIHVQTDVARNAVKLHPVLNIQVPAKP